MEKQAEKESTCCPQIDPTYWDDKVLQWDNRKFIKDRVRTFLFMPIHFGGVMRSLDAKVRQAGATMPDSICLSDHTSKWGMDVYLAVDKEIPDASNVTLSGKFYSRVYEGPFKDTRKWCKDFEEKAKARGLTIKKWYMWYTTCPKCAKRYGKNHVVILTEVD